MSLIDAYDVEQGPEGPVGDQGPVGAQGPAADGVLLPNPNFNLPVGDGTRQPWYLAATDADWQTLAGPSAPPAGYGPALSYRREGRLVKMRGACQVTVALVNGVPQATIGTLPAGFYPSEGGTYRDDEFQIVGYADAPRNTRPIYATAHHQGPQAPQPRTFPGLSINTSSGAITPCLLFFGAASAPNPVLGGSVLTAWFGQTGTVVIVGFEAVEFTANDPPVYTSTSLFPGRLHEGYAEPLPDGTLVAATPLNIGYHPPAHRPSGELIEGPG